ncbi:MAG: RagB/SusD family nutrient uptake outer membrane protein [Adhaeribacter sp.]
MKKILYIALLLSFSTSCQDYLEVLPTDFASPETTYTTAEEANMALTGVYSTLKQVGAYSRYLPIELNFGNDEGFYKGSTNISTETPLINTHGPSTPIINITWSELYKGINRANLLLANIQKPVMDETARGVIKGEALFLRAYFYFQLVHLWGDVPVLLTPTTSGEVVDIPRTPMREVYALILRDMTEAEGLVKTITANNGLSGRVSKTAVQGILARVCLKMAGKPLNDVSKYQEAKQWAEKVILSGEHSLAPDYAQIFRNMSQDLYDPKESIWEVEFKGNGTIVPSEIGGWFAGQLSIDNSSAALYGYANIGATSILYEKYEALDVRRNRNVVPFFYSPSSTSDPTKISYHAATVMHNRDTGKWRISETLLSPHNRNLGPTNFPLLRYADVLLMYAEAENEINGPTPQAIDYVNQVRRRGYGKLLNGEGNVSEGIKSITRVSGGSGYTSAPTVTITGAGGVEARATASVATSGTRAVTAITLADPGYKFTGNPTITITGGGGTGATATASVFPVSNADVLPAQAADKDSFRRLLQDERARELCYEGLRKFDLIRWGIFLDVMKDVANDFELDAPSSLKFAATGYNNVRVKHLLLPIPTDEIQVNGSMTQNPGW